MNIETFWLLCPLLGALSGILAGLLGIGGGLVLVPALYAAELLMGVPDSIALKMALGTSMGTIALTGVSSALNHHRRGSVVWQIVKQCVPSLILGAMFGAALIQYLDVDILKILFGLFGVSLGIKMLFLEPQSHLTSKQPFGFSSEGAQKLPHFGFISLFSTMVGIVSALVGIGGGTLNVPLFLRWKCNMTQAIGTAAACGVPIAWGGMIGYVWQGWQVPHLPPYSLGFVAWIPVVLLGAAGMLSARWGVALAHYLPKKQLNIIFALILIIIGNKMAWQAV